MTATLPITRMVTAATELPGGGEWWQVLEGTVLVGRPTGPGAHPVDHPAFATLRPGDLLVPGVTRSLLVRPVGRVVLGSVTPPADPFADPAVGRWVTTLAAAAHTPADGLRDRAAVDEPVTVVVERLLDAIAEQDESVARERVERARMKAAPSDVDAAAIHELVSAVPALHSGRQPAADITAELLLLLGLPVTPIGPQPAEPAPAVGERDVLAPVRRRAAREGHLLREVEVDAGIRADLLTPVVASLAGRPVVLAPRWRGTVVIDPADGSRRRLTPAQVADLGPTGLAAIRELPRRSGLKDLARMAWRGNRADAATVLVAALVAALMSLVVPLAGGAIFNEIVPGDQDRRLLGLTLALLMVILATAVLSVLEGRVTARIRTRLDSAAGDAIWARLMRLPVSFFNRHGSGELLARASVVDTLRQVVTDSVVSSLVAGATVLVSLGLVLVQSPSAGLLVLGIVVVQAIGFWWVLRRWGAMTEEQVVEQQVLSDQTLQVMRGIARIRVFAAEERVMRLLAARFADVTRTSYGTARFGAGVAVALAAWPTLGTLAVTAGVALAGSSAANAGTYVVITTALGQVLAGTSGLVNGMSQLIGVQPQLRQLEPILATEPETGGSAGSTGGRESTPELRGGLELSGVSFRYAPDGPDVLQDISLTVRPGEFVALVGPSGSGKSTLLRLILGFEAADSGVVSFDGTPLERMDPRSVRRQLGTVLQNSSLFPGSLADNIRGPRSLTQDQLWAAAEAAAVATDIRRMPMGLQTLVVEGAATLSGGQRQRIVIARALAGSPRMLLFDEATSALDNVSQAEVAESLDRLQVTRLVVAHRLSTIRHADRIVVLDAGRIVQQGSYDDLIAAPGLFQDLATRQLVETP